MTSGPKISALEVFRGPIKDFLKREITSLGHDPVILDSIVERSIDTAMQEVETDLSETGSVLRNERFVRGDIEETALDYVKAVLSQGRKMRTLKELIKSYGSVFIVGAGISFESGLPLITHLRHLLKFCLLNEFTELPKYNDKSYVFKTEFKKLSDGKKPTASHRSIAVHFGGSILEIICLNWDDLIERALTEVPGPAPKIVEEVDDVQPGHYLWKPHGDVGKIDGDNKVGKGGWVFPLEEGYIFDCFTKYINALNGLNSRMFVLVIAGYSEGDKAISDKVISVLAPNRPVYRVVLDLKHLQSEEYIVGPSDYVLPNVLN